MMLNETTFETNLPMTEQNRTEPMTMSTSTQHPPLKDNSDCIAIGIVVAVVVFLIVVVGCCWFWRKRLSNQRGNQSREVTELSVGTMGSGAEAWRHSNMPNGNEREEQEPLN